MTGDERIAFDMLCTQLNRVENKVDVLSSRFDKFDGERKAARWFMVTAGGFAGAVLAFIGDIISRKL